jgi:hypothetical protein
LNEEARAAMRKGIIAILRDVNKFGVFMQPQITIAFF